MNQGMKYLMSMFNEIFCKNAIPRSNIPTCITNNDGIGKLHHVSALYLLLWQHLTLFVIHQSCFCIVSVTVATLDIICNTSIMFLHCMLLWQHLILFVIHQSCFCIVSVTVATLDIICNTSIMFLHCICYCGNT